MSPRPLQPYPPPDLILRGNLVRLWRFAASLFRSSGILHGILQQPAESARTAPQTRRAYRPGVHLRQLDLLAHAHKPIDVGLRVLVHWRQAVPPQQVVLNRRDRVGVAVDLAVGTAVLLPGSDGRRDARHHPRHRAQIDRVGAAVQMGQDRDAARRLRARGLFSFAQFVNKIE